jgi:hypothetical protein
MDPRRIAFWMLAVAGVAVGHIAGYAIAHPDAAGREAALGGHAYLPVAASVLVPLGVVAALAWAVQTARSMGMSGHIDARRLALAQIGVFAVQEVAERIVNGAGAGSALAERGVWIGLVAQVVVALLVTRAVDLASRAVRFVVRGRRPTSTLVADVGPFRPHAVLRSIAAPVAVGLRAPPVVGSPR